MPLPDTTGRGKLVRTYGNGLPPDEAMVTDAVRLTPPDGAAFIEDLMLRIAELWLASHGGNCCAISSNLKLSARAARSIAR
ncbi:hypothetical protein A5906_24755 [Bradyrhizobium sacchari]|uniref:hypothetical protein n=1 Tax=Bradyrhizobium sacchari TaxID=1399419 RepID=UPI0009AFAA41|nr:hypothetical protein [Bradyrhizobium sacchari]OPY99868.1 hypothetical protein A5906_24755 [Bradyrhizobium sacchari]